MDVVVLNVKHIMVDGRRIIPVRLIPFLIALEFEPDAIVRWFGTNDYIFKGHVASYLLTEAGYQVTDDNFWQFYERQIKALKQDKTLGENWINLANQKLPPSVFVWLDEFEVMYKNMAAPLMKGFLREEDKHLNLQRLIPPEQNEFVLKGFCNMASVLSANSIPPIEEKALVKPLPFKVKRERSKLQTLEKHHAWLTIYDELKKADYNTDISCVAREIVRRGLGQGAGFDAIRKKISTLLKERKKFQAPEISY